MQMSDRYYGQSKPTEDMSTMNMRYLSSRQGLEDLGHFVSAINTKNNLTNPTWITFGGSYPGSLSAWMRLRFPHLITGSVSSSGPLFAKLDYLEYLQVGGTRVPLILLSRVPRYKLHKEFQIIEGDTV